MNWYYFAATIGIGTIGGFVAKKLHFPAGPMIGALVFVAILNAGIGFSAYPYNLRIFMQTISGIVIGSRFTKEDVIELKKIIKPALLLNILLLSFTVLFAVMMVHFSTLDLPTAFFSTAPGGVSDLALIAADMGANPQQVALLQLTRLVFVLFFFPLYMKKDFAKNVPLEQNKANPVEKSAQSKTVVKIIPFIVALTMGIGGGYLFRFLRIPAGAIVGSIFGTILASFFVQNVSIPRPLRTIAQILTGCYIGSQMTRAAIHAVPLLFIPMLIIIVGMLCMAFISAALLCKISRMDYLTCLFACTPGGITEMGLIAEDLGLDTPKIIMMHTCRIIAVICFFPLVAKFLV